MEEMNRKKTLNKSNKNNGKMSKRNIMTSVESNENNLTTLTPVYVTEPKIKGKVSDYSIQNLIKLGIDVTNRPEMHLNGFVRFNIAENVEALAKQHLENIEKINAENAKRENQEEKPVTTTEKPTEN